LLKRWATVNNFVANTRFIDYCALEDSDFVGKLNGLNAEDYAITGLLAALFVAPWVRTNKAHIYVRTELDAKRLVSKLDLVPIERVGNLRFSIAKSSGVFYGARGIESLKIVSDIQLYVDLLDYPARGAQAASMVCEVIKKDWREEVV
jgi:hypothetical protein